MAAGGGAKRRYQYCTEISGTLGYFRALQGHSGRNLIDPSLQDNVIIQCGLFRHICHLGCAPNLHSITNNGLIPGGQDSSKRQTVFFLPIDPRDKDHEDPAHIDFSVPRRARSVHSAWKKHQDAVFWVDIDLAIRKGLVVKGETSRSHGINEKGFHGELGSSDRSGKPDKLSESTRVEQTHDDQGNLMSETAQVHTQ